MLVGSWRCGGIVNHAGNTAAGKVCGVFFPGGLKPGPENPLMLSEINLCYGDIFIMIKAITQQGAN